MISDLWACLEHINIQELLGWLRQKHPTSLHHWWPHDSLTLDFAHDHRRGTWMCITYHQLEITAWPSSFQLSTTMKKYWRFAKMGPQIIEAMTMTYWNTRIVTYCDFGDLQAKLPSHGSIFSEPGLHPGGQKSLVTFFSESSNTFSFVAAAMPRWLRENNHVHGRNDDTHSWGFLRILGVSMGIPMFRNIFPYSGWFFSKGESSFHQ